MSVGFAEPITAPVVETGEFDGLVHYCCEDCNPDLSFCGEELGRDVTGTEINPADECVVCLSLMEGAPQGRPCCGGKQ